MVAVALTQYSTRSEEKPTWDKLDACAVTVVNEIVFAHVGSSGNLRKLIVSEVVRIDFRHPRGVGRGDKAGEHAAGSILIGDVHKRQAIGMNRVVIRSDRERRRADEGETYKDADCDAFHGRGCFLSVALI